MRKSTVFVVCFHHELSKCHPESDSAAVLCTWVKLSHPIAVVSVSVVKRMWHFNSFLWHVGQNGLLFSLFSTVALQAMMHDQDNLNVFFGFEKRTRMDCRTEKMICVYCGSWCLLMATRGGSMTLNECMMRARHFLWPWCTLKTFYSLLFLGFLLSQ